MPSVFQAELDDAKRLQAKLAKCIKPGWTARRCAKAVEKVLRKAALDEGQKPDIEVFVKGPADHHYAGKCWLVNWEAGPYEWAIEASFALGEAGKRLVEPYYSFDLCFYDNE